MGAGYRLKYFVCTIKPSELMPGETTVTSWNLQTLQQSDVWIVNSEQRTNTRAEVEECTLHYTHHHHHHPLLCLFSPLYNMTEPRSSSSSSLVLAITLASSCWWSCMTTRAEQHHMLDECDRLAWPLSSKHFIVHIALYKPIITNS